jgi:ribosomal protein S27AE
MPKKPSWKTLRKKADRLLQQYITLKNRDCLVCGEDVFCGHHFITKKNAEVLRYYIPNIIPICRNCHSKVHTQPHLVEPVICFQKGSEWYEDLIIKKREMIKKNREWYQNHITRLENLIKDLEMEKI